MALHAPSAIDLRTTSTSHANATNVIAQIKLTDYVSHPMSTTGVFCSVKLSKKGVKTKKEIPRSA